MAQPRQIRPPRTQWHHGENPDGSEWEERVDPPASLERQIGLRPRTEVVPYTGDTRPALTEQKLAVLDQGSEGGWLRELSRGFYSRNRQLQLSKDLHDDLMDSMRAMFRASLGYDLWKLMEDQRHTASLVQIDNQSVELRKSVGRMIETQKEITVAAVDKIKDLVRLQAEIRAADPKLADRTEQAIGLAINRLTATAGSKIEDR